MAHQQRAPSHICVFGVGGVGGYFGGKLAWWLAAQTDPSWQVHFVARGAHLAEINRSGLVLDTPGLRMTCVPTSAAEHLGDLPVPDIVLVCVKSYGLAEAVRQIAAHRHGDTAVIPLLNGVDIHARIRAGLRSGPVLPAGVVVGTHLERPGVVSQAGGDGVMFVGRDPDCPGFVPDSFLGLLEKAGIRHRWLDDPRPALWEKYVFISAFGLVTAAWRKSVGEVLVDARLLVDVKGIMNEVASLAAREGIALDPGVVANALARANGFPFDTRTSLQRDVEAGRRHEGDLFGGAILRMGERLGVPTPFTERVYARIPTGSCPS